MPHKFNIHLVYIKLEESDYKDEPSFPGYYDNADFYWIATPRDHITKAIDYIKDYPNIGILYYNKNNNSINIHKKALPDINYGSKRLETIEMLANEML